MTRDFLLDAVERAVKTFAQSLLAFFGADALDVLQADWGTALSVSAGAVVLSLVATLLYATLTAAHVFPGAGAAGDAGDAAGWGGRRRVGAARECPAFSA